MSNGNLGGWNADTNTPTIVAGTGTAGDFYTVTTPGARDIEAPVGPDPVQWFEGDQIVFQSGTWIRVPNEVVVFDNGVNEKRRAVTDKLRDTISALDASGFEFGKAVDQRANIEALIAERAADGDVVELPAGQIYLTGLTIPQGVSLRGASSRGGHENVNRDYSKLGTVIWLDPGVGGANTITLDSTSRLENVTILNPRLEYVKMTGDTPNLTLDQMLGTAVITVGPNAGKTAGIADFSGVAITNLGHDTVLRNVLIIGFEQGYLSGPNPSLAFGIGPCRMQLEDVWFDCTNGIDISDCWDVPRIDGCHGWNFFTGLTGLPWQAAKRDGVAYNIHDKVDGLMITNCFALGWRTTYRFANMYACQMTGCTGDSLIDIGAVDATSVGLLTEGTVNGLHISSVRCDGNATNFAFRHTSGMVLGMIASGTTANGTFIEVGPNCSGLTVDAMIGGLSAIPIRIRPGARNVMFKTVSAYYMSNPGELFVFDSPADIPQVAIGHVNLEKPGLGVHTFGSRLRDYLTVSTDLPTGLGLKGGGAGLAASVFASTSLAYAQLDLEAKGNVPDAACVRIARRLTTGQQQVLARFDATEGIVPPDLLFRGQTANQMLVVPEGAANDISIALWAKGDGAIDVGGNKTNFLRTTGGGTGAPPTLAAAGGDTDIHLQLASKGAGSVVLQSLGGMISRFVKSVSNTASLLVFGQSPGLISLIAESSAADAILHLSGKGTGGIYIDVATAANDAGAASAGVIVGGLYFDTTGVLRRRLV